VVGVLVVVVAVFGMRALRPQTGTLSGSLALHSPQVNLLLAATLAITLVIPSPVPQAVVIGHLAGLLLIAQLGTLPGTAWIALGVVCNAAVILANGAMPVWPDAIEFLGAGREALLASPRHEAMTAATELAVLGDVLPVPVIRLVVSLGDVLMFAGAARALSTLLEVPAPRLVGATA